MGALGRTYGKLGSGWGKNNAQLSEFNSESNTLEITLRGGSKQNSIVFLFENVPDANRASSISYAVTQWASILNERRVNALLNRIREDAPKTQFFTFDVDPDLMTMLRCRHITGVQFMVGTFAPMPRHHLEPATEFYRFTTVDQTGHYDLGFDVVSGAGVMCGNPVLWKHFAQATPDSLTNNKEWSAMSVRAAIGMKDYPLTSQAEELMCVMNDVNSALTWGDPDIIPTRLKDILASFEYMDPNYLQSMAPSKEPVLNGLAEVPQELLEQLTCGKLKRLVVLQEGDFVLRDESNLLCRYAIAHPPRNMNHNSPVDIALINTFYRGDFFTSTSSALANPVLEAALTRINEEVTNPIVEVEPGFTSPKTFMSDFNTRNWLVKLSAMELPLFVIKEANITLSALDELAIITFLSESKAYDRISLARSIVKEWKASDGTLPLEWVLLSIAE